MIIYIDQHLQFQDVKDGLKTVEAKLNTEKWKDVRVGDDFIWTYDNQQVITRVVDVYYYPSFSDMINTEGLPWIFPRCSSVDEGVKYFEYLYDKVEECMYGVVAFTLRII